MLLRCWFVAMTLSWAALAQTTAPPTPVRPPAKPPATEVAGIHVNYDEALVGTYTLPDPLVLANGKPVKDAKIITASRPSRKPATT